MPEQPRTASAVKGGHLARHDGMHMPRLATETQVATALGIPLATVRHLVACGRLPKALPEFDLYDMKAVEAALDRMSGLQTPTNALDCWRESRDARAR
jgi:hypothetical protein